MSGLVLLLPHGYEGPGAGAFLGPARALSRSSAPSATCRSATSPRPANYFHALRRQLKRNFRKPLVVMTPKSLLRHKLAVSPLADMAEGSPSTRCIGEIDRSRPTAGSARRALRAGKVYYDLLAERRAKEIDDVALRPPGADLSVPGQAR